MQPYEQSPDRTIGDEDTPDLTGEALFAEVVNLAAEAGWGFGGAHAGRVVSDSGTESASADGVESRVCSGNTRSMRRTGRVGHRRQWILEVQLIDRRSGFGGLHKELLQRTLHEYLPGD